MSFVPLAVGGGLPGWYMLRASEAAQRVAFARQDSMENEASYFRDRIQNVTDPGALVADRRLLGVALGAFGLSDDIGNRFYIRKVLEEGTIDERSFANRLADKRYFRLAKTFGFDKSPPNTVTPGFSERILEQYRRERFNIAVGEQDEDLRLALSLEDELRRVAPGTRSEKAEWYALMASPPLRRVFEAALGLPATIGALDIDRQLDAFREKARVKFGVQQPSDFLAADRLEDLRRRFLLASQTVPGPTSRGSAALMLLQTSRAW